MDQTPASPGPGRDGDPPGVPPGPGDRRWLGSPHWRLVPQRPDWDEAYLAAMADDEDPGDPDDYQDPDNAPPPGLDDAELAVLLAEAREITAGQARAGTVTPSIAPGRPCASRVGEALAVTECGRPSWVART